MAIYDIFEIEKNALERKNLSTEEPVAQISQPSCDKAQIKDHLFSAITARFFFLLLLVADLLWATYSLIVFGLVAVSSLISGGKVSSLRALCARRWLALKRSLICAVALGITLFSPSFGIMIACTYFLMYDKSGIEEVVPSSLQDQFKEFFKAQ